MKHTCDECEGDGKIICPSCDGRGVCTSSIDAIRLDKDMEHYDELRALKNDAHRLRQQAATLIKLKPEFRGTYSDQLIVALNQVESIAQKLVEA